MFSADREMSSYSSVWGKGVRDAATVGGSKERSQGKYSTRTKLTPEEVIEKARRHFEETNGLQEESGSENCLSLQEEGPSLWMGAQVFVSACPIEGDNMTEVTVQHHHRDKEVRLFLFNLK